MADIKSVCLSPLPFTPIASPFFREYRGPLAPSRIAPSDQTWREGLAHPRKRRTRKRDRLSPAPQPFRFSLREASLWPFNLQLEVKPVAIAFLLCFLPAFALKRHNVLEQNAAT